MKIIFLILLTFFSCFASENKENLFTSVKVSFDNKTYTDIAKTEDFSDYKYLYLKFDINKDVLKDKIYYLRFNYAYKSFVSVNAKAKKDDNSTIVKIDKNISNPLIFKFKNEYDLNTYLDLDLFTSETFSFYEKYEFLFFGLAYGIVFCAFLYNLVLFIYTRYKVFFYYSGLEFSILFLLLTTVMTPPFFKPFYEYIYVPDFFGQLTVIFAILFNRYFLNSMKRLPRLDKFLLFLQYSNILDLVYFVFFKKSIIYEYVPTIFIIFILLLSSFLVYKQGYKIAIFYILGWGVIFLSTLLIEIGLSDFQDVYALHIGMPLESLILSFTLAYKMKVLEEEKKEQEKMLIHQNKLASMGEMINNIAHQYRQPLTHIAYVFMNIKSAFENNELDEKYLNKKVEQGNNQLLFLSQTIDNFRDFYNKDKEKVEFDLKDSIFSAVNILSPQFKQKDINLVLNLDEKVMYKGLKNEFSQVILNLLTNAKDALIEQNIKEPTIIINLKKLKKQIEVEVVDNAKGVKDEYKEKIFEPYFSTKSKSSGIGLYMSSMIITEHFDGKLILENTQSGACFKIILNRTIMK